MKRFILLLVVGIISASCSKENLQSDLKPQFSVNSETEQPVYYQSSTGQFFIHQNDPFSLDNMQAAYDYLAENEQFTKSGSFEKGKSLQPTHYALKVYPRTIEEQWAIEAMDNIQITYHPFDYAPVSVKGQDVLNVDAAFEKSPYKETLKYDTENGLIKEETYVLPIMYVVWPINKPLPEGYDYKVDYQVFIPEAQPITKSSMTLSKNERLALEDEALYRAIGKRILYTKPEIQTKQLRDEDDSSDFKILQGYVSIYDNFLETQVPAQRLTMRFELGTFIYDGTTTDNGYYDMTIHTQYHPYLNFSFYFQTSHFIITLNNSTAIYYDSQGQMTSVFGPDLYCYKDFAITNSSLAYPIYRAAQYYYYGNHPVTPFDSGIPIWINAKTDYGPWPFVSYEMYNSVPQIVIKSNILNQHNYYIGAVLHGLGHHTHNGWFSYANYTQINEHIRESFACYIGWKLGEKYYFDLGFSPALFYDYVGQNRQDWDYTWAITTNQYSPIFIDLEDSYNQRNNNTHYPQDVISGIPYGDIEDILSFHHTWLSIRDELETLIVNYYNQDDFDSFIEAYDDWYENLEEVWPDLDPDDPNPFPEP